MLSYQTNAKKAYFFGWFHLYIIRMGDILDIVWSRFKRWRKHWTCDNPRLMGSDTRAMDYFGGCYSGGYWTSYLGKLKGRRPFSLSVMHYYYFIAVENISTPICSNGKGYLSIYILMVEQYEIWVEKCPFQWNFLR